MKFSQFRDPPPNRRNRCDGYQECHMTEPAVMIAFALHLLGEGAGEIAIHPDGEHGRIFDIKACLEANNFKLTEKIGSTSYGGSYERGSERLNVTLIPGKGDVETYIGGQKLVAECKGGIINTRHSGQASRLRRGLCEAVGLLIARPLDKGRQVAVVPTTEITTTIARRMLPRAKIVGIEIALVTENGQVEFLK